MDEIEEDNFYISYVYENDPKLMAVFGDVIADTYANGQKLMAVFDATSGQRILQDFTGVVKNSGKRVTLLNGIVHSFNDEPAISMLDAVCTKQWVCNGVVSRHTGPALIYFDGNYRFVINGVKYTFDEFIKLSNATDEQKIEMLLKYS